MAPFSTSTQTHPSMKKHLKQHRLRYLEYNRWCSMCVIMFCLFLTGGVGPPQNPNFHHVCTRNPNTATKFYTSQMKSNRYLEMPQWFESLRCGITQVKFETIMEYLQYIIAQTNKHTHLTSWKSYVDVHHHRFNVCAYHGNLVVWQSTLRQISRHFVLLVEKNAYEWHVVHVTHPKKSTFTGKIIYDIMIYKQ